MFKKNQRKKEWEEMLSEEKKEKRDGSVMRSEKNAALRLEKKYQRDIRLKKMLMVMTVLIFVFGLIAVDRGYSEMMGERGILTPTVRRMNEETLVVSVFGKDIQLNTQQFDVQIVDQEEDQDSKQ